MRAGLCTIETLYFFFKELQESAADGLGSHFQRPNAFDDLLFFFAKQHDVVLSSHHAKKQRSAHQQTAARGSLEIQEAGK
jgi:hypothetical protein